MPRIIGAPRPIPQGTAGTPARPPSWITDAGFEWLYRLLREPRQRWRRHVVHQPPVLYLLARQRLGLYRTPFPNGSGTATGAAAGGIAPPRRSFGPGAD